MSSLQSMGDMELVLFGAAKILRPKEFTTDAPIFRKESLESMPYPTLIDCNTGLPVWERELRQVVSSGTRVYSQHRYWVWGLGEVRGAVLAPVGSGDYGWCRSR